METAKSELNYVGYWLSAGLEQGAGIQSLVRLIARGVRLDFILLDPDAPTLVMESYGKFFSMSEAELRQRTRASLDKLIALRGRLTPVEQLQLSIRTHQAFLSCSAFQFDPADQKAAKILIDTKFFGVDRNGTLGVEVGRPKGTGGFYWRITSSLAAIKAVSTIV